MISTFRLWLEPDPEMSAFQRLCWESVQVPARDVLKRGIHPVRAASALSLCKRFLITFNAEGSKPAALTRFHYTGDLSTPTGHTSRSWDRDSYDALLETIRQEVHFVPPGTTFTPLLTLAKQRLKDRWGTSVARGLLMATCPSFDDQRSFIKAKDTSIKISSYADISALDLGSVLSLEDFQGEDLVLIRHGLPRLTFRLGDCLKAATDESGLLRLTDRINGFELRTRSTGLVLAGQVEGENVCLQPILDQSHRRAVAKRLAERWRTDSGRLCFTTSIDRLQEMLESEEVTIRFPRLNYLDSDRPILPTARVGRDSVRVHTIGNRRTRDWSVETLRQTLGEHGVSMTGRKSDLLRKVAKLVVRLHDRHRAELDTHFRNQRYVRIAGAGNLRSEPFPLLEDLDLRDLVLSLYALRHLRGNVILEAGHLNASCDPESLARALVNGEVQVTGGFLSSR